MGRGAAIKLVLPYRPTLLCTDKIRFVFFKFVLCVFFLFLNQLLVGRWCHSIPIYCIIILFISEVHITAKTKKISNNRGMVDIHVEAE